MIIFLIIGGILLPVVLTLSLPIIGIGAIYKLFATFCLRGRILKAKDAIWTVDADDETSLAVINALAIVSGEEISVKSLETILEQKFIPAHPKLKCLRKYSLFGYFYWEQIQVFELNQFVKPLDCEKVVTEVELRKIMSDLSNSPLPHNHLANWEIFLGPKIVYDEKIHQAIICRLHHSLGDGPALFRTLLSSLASSEDQNLFTRDNKIFARPPVSKNKSILENCVDVGTALREQTFLPKELNFLHGLKLSGSKQLAWCSSVQLMSAAKTIRSSTGATFSAGLLASLLAAFAKFGNYSDTTNSYTFILPVQVPSTKIKATAEMSNDFSLTVVVTKLPGKEVNVLSQVQAADLALKHATKPAVLLANNCIIKLIGWLCPKPLAALFLSSRQCTAAFSNVPGPERKMSLFGSTLEKLIFWVPTKDNTGVGVSILSYAGELSLGLNMDCAYFKGTDEAQQITALWAEQLIYMADILSK